jgi:CRISPR-associated protein Cas4
MEKDITGIMVYYYEVCKRKLWYFYHNINMEQNNENVAIGKFINETSYIRSEKHINIDNVINIDFIKSEGILHEVKKSKKIEEASILQVKYYLYYLSQRGVNVKAQIDYPLLKRSVKIDITEEDKLILDKVLEDIEKIVIGSIPKEEKNKMFCKSCAFFDLCYI